MAATLPFQNQCCTPCEDQITANIPGATGDDGADGSNGTNGKNAYTTTTAAYTQPAAGADVVVNVNDSTWAVVGQEVFVQTGGHYTVIAKTTTSKMTLRNLDYSDNAAVADVVASGKQVGPSGHIGNSGSTSGASGGDLKGTYPDPLIGLANGKGELIVGDDTDAQTLAAPGVNGYRLRSNDAAPLGADWAAIGLANAGGFTEVSGVLGLANGGTSGATPAAGFDALAPTTTRGDLVVRGVASNERMALGAAGTVVQSNGTDLVEAKIGVTSLDATVGRSPVNVYIAKHSVASSVAGGGATSGSWLTRPLNVESVNTIGGSASLAANQITLPAGTYRVRGYSCMNAVDFHRCGLFNASDASWLTDTTDGGNIVGPVADAAAAVPNQSTAVVEGRFTIGAAKLIELRYRCETTNAADGLGLPTSWGVNEIYAMAVFEKEAI